MMRPAGAQLGNLVACSLLKYTQSGRTPQRDWELYYLRDKEGREVDFVAHEIGECSG